MDPYTQKIHTTQTDKRISLMLARRLFVYLMTTQQIDNTNRHTKNLYSTNGASTKQTV